jgi:uncharacterized protein (TIGR00725 family)
MPTIAVIGAGQCNARAVALAEEVGRRLAQAGVTVVCGGLSGVMEAACRGAKSAGGLTIGILPGTSRGDANRWVDIAIPTGLGEARNIIVVRTAQAVIAVGGEFGTLSEIAFALKFGIPVIGLNTWQLARAGKIQSSVHEAKNSGEAVNCALKAVPLAGKADRIDA